MPPGRKYLLITILGPSGVQFRNHTNDWQNRTTTKGESDLLITSIITDRIRRREVLLYVYKKEKNS